MTVLLLTSNSQMILSQDSEEPGEGEQANCASDLSEVEQNVKFQEYKKGTQNVKLQLKISNEVLQLSLVYGW